MSRFDIAVSTLIISGGLIAVVMPSMDAGSVSLCRWYRGMIIAVALLDVAVGIALGLGLWE